LSDMMCSKFLPYLLRLESTADTGSVYSLFVLYYIADLENVILIDTSKEFSNVSL